MGHVTASAPLARRVAAVVNRRPPTVNAGRRGRRVARSPDGSCTRTNRRHVTAASSRCAGPCTARSSTWATCTPSIIWAPALNPCLCGPAIPASTGFSRWRRASRRPALRIGPHWSAAWRGILMDASRDHVGHRRHAVRGAGRSRSASVVGQWRCDLARRRGAPVTAAYRTGRRPGHCRCRDAWQSGSEQHEPRRIVAWVRACPHSRRRPHCSHRAARTARVMATINPVACYLRELVVRAIPVTTVARILVRINRRAGTAANH